MSTEATSVSTTASPTAPSAPAVPVNTSATTAPNHHSTSQARAPDGKWQPGQAPPPEPGAANVVVPPTAAERRLFKVKVDGEEVEIDEERAKAELAMGLAAKKRFSQLDQEKRAFEAARAKAKENPWDYLKTLGMDPMQAAYEYLNGVVQEESLTPEQKVFRAQQKELEQREAAIRQQEEQVKQRQDHEAQLAALSLLQKEVPARLEAAGLPKDGAVIGMVTAHLRDAEAAGIPLSPEVVARAVEMANEDLSANVTRIANTLTPEQAAKRFPELAKKLRQYDVEQIRARSKQPVAAPAQRQELSAPKEKKFLSFDEWQKLNR